jgi:hypothetical protein
MISDPPASRGSPAAFMALVAGAGLIVLAWMLPVNLKSVSPALLRAAGQGTPTVAELGRQLVDAEKAGPAQLVLEAARSVKDPGADELERAVRALAAQQKELVAWGGWDPFLEPLFKLQGADVPAQSTPVLDFMLPQAARASLLAYLNNSRSLGVQALLKTRALTDTGRFVPVNEPGGQPLDAVILLTALLYQGGHLSPALQRELRLDAETADRRQRLGELEPFYMDILSLSQRLDWVQLGELLRRTDSGKTVNEYAHLARVARDQLPLFYTAALFSDSADRVADYLIRHGKAGAADLRLALADGRGAVRQLMAWQLPVQRRHTLTLGGIAGLALPHPKWALFLKYLGFVLGAFLVFRGLDRTVFPRGDGTAPSLPRMQSGVLALALAGLLVLVTEPDLLKAAPISEYRFKITMPLLANTGAPPAPPPVPLSAMNTSTIVTIAIFAALQIATYLICLRKLGEIYRQDLPAPLKLRLIENEDNLFDSGLYVGMMGTAAALVLQVLGVIDHNLLAAYSSNLFGLVCVALVKIRHVRGFKRRLIIEAQG